MLLQVTIFYSMTLNTIFSWYSSLLITIYWDCSFNKYLVEILFIEEYYIHLFSYVYKPQVWILLADFPNVVLVNGPFVRLSRTFLKIFNLSIMSQKSKSSFFHAVFIYLLCLLNRKMIFKCIHIAQIFEILVA